MVTPDQEEVRDVLAQAREGKKEGERGREREKEREREGERGRERERKREGGRERERGREGERGPGSSPRGSSNCTCSEPARLLRIKTEIEMIIALSLIINLCKNAENQSGWNSRWL